MTAVGVYLNLITGQSARINRDTCSPWSGEEEEKVKEAERTGGNLISATGERARICGDEYADSPNCPSKFARTSPRKHMENCATRSRDSAATARFMRITLFDVQKFPASASRPFSSSPRFYGGQVSCTCGVAERAWRGYQTHVTPGRTEWFAVAASELTSCYYSSSDRVHSNIFTINICKVFTIHLDEMLLRYMCNSYLFRYWDSSSYPRYWMKFSKYTDIDRYISAVYF